MPTRKRPSLDDDGILWLLAALAVPEPIEQEIRDRAERSASAIATYTLALAVRSAWAEVEAQRASGVSLEDTKARLREVLTKEWGDGEGWRTDLMAGMATQFAYQRGRWAEMQAAGRKGELWRYNSALEARTCAHCWSLHGTTLPGDHPWWLTHWPELHPHCLCQVTLAPPGAQETVDIPDYTPDDGFGTTPIEFIPSYTGWPAPISAAARKKG